MSEARVALIRERLEQNFQPSTLTIVDESHLHAGHASAGGAGHFAVELVSEAFTGKSTLERHRMVYAAMDELMNTEVHALSIKALSPEERQ